MGLNEQPLSVIGIQGRASILVIESGIPQDPCAIQGFQVSGLLQDGKMGLIDGCATLPQLVKSGRCGVVLPAGRLSVGGVQGFGWAVDEREPLRHSLDGKNLFAAGQGSPRHTGRPDS